MRFFFFVIGFRFKFISPNITITHHFIAIFALIMVYFVSDIHLGLLPRPQDKELEERFVAFLSILKSGDTLVLLGDIFDYWFDYKYVIPSAFFHTLAKFAELQSNGVKIEYIIGNHDFAHYCFFKDELGIEIIINDVVQEYYGKKFYLSHGDGKDKRDKGYLMLKKVLGNSVSQKLYRLIHPTIGIGLARRSSHTSRKSSEHKHLNEDSITKFALTKLAEGYDYVIMGHRHIVCDITNDFGRYINLGTWLDEPYYAVFDGKQMELKVFKK